MAKNIIQFEIEKLISIGRADVVFHVNKEERGKLGRLKVSQGNVEWRAAHQRSKGKTLSWEEVANLFSKHGH